MRLCYPRVDRHGAGSVGRSGRRIDPALDPRPVVRDPDEGSLTGALYLAWFSHRSRFAAIS